MRPDGRKIGMGLALMVLTACLPVDTRPVDDAPGAELPHNVRLVYWDDAAVRAVIKDEPIPEGAADPYVWRLNVPWAHLDKRVDDVVPDGRLAHIYVPTNEDYSPFAVVNGRIDPDTLEVLPLIPRLDPRNEHHVRVRLAPGRRQHGDLATQCLPISADRRVKYDDLGRYCELAPDRRSCPYIYEVEGWPLILSVPNRLPNPPSAYCDSVVAWLDNMTVHRDPLPTEGRPRRWEFEGTLEKR